MYSYLEDWEARNLKELRETERSRTERADSCLSSETNCEKKKKSLSVLQQSMPCLGFHREPRPEEASTVLVTELHMTVNTNSLLYLFL